MIYPIVKYPEPILETPAAPVTEFGPELHKLVDDMFETMYHARGVGLAAPQIGVSRRITVVDCSIEGDPPQKHVLINPELIHREGKVTQSEGCLSLPDIREKVARAKKVRVRAQNVEGEWVELAGEDLLARAFQHEIDHLNGILFIQHVSTLKRDLIKRKIKKLIKDGEW